MTKLFLEQRLEEDAPVMLRVLSERTGGLLGTLSVTAGTPLSQIRVMLTRFASATKQVPSRFHFLSVKTGKYHQIS